MAEPLILQTNVPHGVIDLGVGSPDPELLPISLLEDSAKSYFAGGDRRPLLYGLEQGDGYFRQALGGFLSDVYGTDVDPGALFILSGASTALDLLCTLYTAPGDTIFVEEPTYFLALKVFADHGLRPIPVPMDAEGLRIDELIRLLSLYRPKFLYTIPTFQNPSGRTLSQTRREELAVLAVEHNFMVLADEVYHCLSYADAPPPPMAAFCEGNPQVVSIGSFSKILAPGLRLGWVQAHDQVIQRLFGCGLLDSGGGLAPYVSALVRKLVESGGLAQNVSALQQVYTSRLAAMDSALRQYLPQAEYERPQGGYFFWVRLPGMNAMTLRHKAQASLVDIRPGTLFSCENGMGEYFRLGFSYYDLEKIREGVRRLANAVAL